MRANVQRVIVGVATAALGRIARPCMDRCLRLREWRLLCFRQERMHKLPHQRRGHVAMNTVNRRPLLRRQVAGAEELVHDGQHRRVIAVHVLIVGVVPVMEVGRRQQPLQRAKPPAQVGMNEKPPYTVASIMISKGTTSSRFPASGWASPNAYMGTKPHRRTNTTSRGWAWLLTSQSICSAL